MLKLVERFIKKKMIRVVEIEENNFHVLGRFVEIFDCLVKFLEDLK